MKSIIALWAHPRSLSTVFERVMMKRGDFEVLHEPFSYEYYVHKQRREVSDMVIDTDHPQRYADIKDYILGVAERRAVFFKDMAYYCWENLVRDEAFLSGISSTFLIRNPSKSIASYYSLDPDVTLEEIGYESQFYVFERVVDLMGEKPIVIDADDLQSNPAGVVAAYCRALGIRFIPESLQWEESFKREWNVWRRWHIDIAQSTGITKESTEYPTTVENNAHLRSYYEHHYPYYEKMYEHRLVL